MTQTCPKCGNRSLEKEESRWTIYECQNKHCGQRFDRTDYIRTALSGIWSFRQEAFEKVFQICVEEVEHGN